MRFGPTVVAVVRKRRTESGSSRSGTYDGDIGRSCALAAEDDFYIRRGLGPARALRVDLPETAPRALEPRAQLRYLRAVDGCPSPRDQAPYQNRWGAPLMRR